MIDRINEVRTFTGRDPITAEQYAAMDARAWAREIWNSEGLLTINDVPNDDLVDGISESLRAREARNQAACDAIEASYNHLTAWKRKYQWAVEHGYTGSRSNWEGLAFDPARAGLARAYGLTEPIDD